MSPVMKISSLQVESSHNGARQVTSSSSRLILDLGKRSSLWCLTIRAAFRGESPSRTGPRRPVGELSLITLDSMESREKTREVSTTTKHRAQ